MTEPLPPVVLSALRAAAAAIEAEADPIAERIARLLHEQSPELMGDPASVAETRQASAATIRSFVTSLRHGEAPGAAEPARPALVPAQVLARAGIGVRPLLRFCHIGHGAFLQAWDEALSGAELAPEVLLAASRASRDITFAWMDRFGERLTDEYERERSRWEQTGGARVRASVAALMREDPLDPDATSLALGHELRRWQTAALLWRAAEPAGEGRLRGAALELASALGADRPLVLASGPGAVRVWVGTHHRPEAAVLAALAEGPRADGTSIAVGAPAYGPAGFRSSAVDAEEAFRLALAAGHPAGTTTLFDRVELAALLTQDLKRARRFVARQLGVLAREDEDSARLRATLDVFLQENGSRPATAHRLGIHPNTVSNRVRTCFELLERDPAEDALALRVALAVVAALGDGVLS